MLETPFPFFICKKPGVFRYLELFYRKNWFFANFGLCSLKIHFLSPAMLENVIVTSYVDRFSWFWYRWKEKTLPYTMVPNNHTLGPSISSSLGGGNHPPLVNYVTKKGLVGRGLKYEFLRLILVMDLHYGFDGQFLENFKKWWRHSTGGIIIFALGDPLRYIYELR